MKAKNKYLRKVLMWYKVKELKETGLNKSQISREVGIDRGTVRTYLSMSEEEFHKWIEKGRHLPKKLNMYYEYVKELLTMHPYLSSAQVEDRLKENFSGMPQVHSKTVYNFVQGIREAHGIKKDKENLPRQYEKLEETEYGHQAQVDFGQYMMQTKEASRKKVYFFDIVLCRSRQKYVYFQTHPFTTETAILAHEKAFAYFEGQPKEIIYDQDRVFITDENMGDILMTKEFRSYYNQMDFKVIFCRKSDPESKGKIENVVKYIKYNFLRGRIFTGEDELNRSVLSWLGRTANSKEHAGTKKIPMQEWQIEKQYLLPLKPQTIKQENKNLLRYKVRKDNTISYKSNFYTLPLGTYKNADTWVLLKEENEEIRLYTENEDLLTIHPICYKRGVTIRNTDHSRDKSQSIAPLIEEVIKMMPDKNTGSFFINKIYKDKPRYVRDNLLLLKKHLPELDKDIVQRSVDFCLENNIYNSKKLIEIANHYITQQQEISKTKIIIPDIKINSEIIKTDFIPQKSKLSTYEIIM
jgi:transposase